MTLEFKAGPENVVDAVKFTIAGSMPAQITSVESTLFKATLRAYKKENYTFDGAKTISVTVDKTTTITATPPSDTYTAEELKDWLNAQPTFTAELTASTFMNDKYLAISKSGAGGDRVSLKANDTTGNAVLGWNEFYAYNNVLLRQFKLIEAWYANIDPTAYPACLIFCTGYSDLEPGEIRSYDIRVRVYETIPDPTFADALYRNLMRYAGNFNYILTPASTSRSLSGQVNAINLTSATFGDFIEVPNEGRAAMYRGLLELNYSIEVQENN